MRVAALSDVHGNIEALDAVLHDMEGRGIDEIYCLGDSVGYGPNPNECLGVLSDRSGILLAGNHDQAAIGLLDIEYFNEEARTALLWTRAALNAWSRKILGSLPVEKAIPERNLLLVHSTPREPETWHYMMTLWDAEINFHYFDQRICILGHSHQPFVIERLPSGEMASYRDRATLGKSERYIINAGSVGQPRDRDPRACYVVIEDEKVEFVRVQYDIEKTQKKMREAGLPLFLIERLAKGI